MRGPVRRSQRYRPMFECLEDRLAPATITVTTRADVVKPGDGKISLREAITRANATKAPDTIVLGKGVYTIALAAAMEDANASGDFDVTGPLTIKGQGAKKTIIDAARLDRLFEIHGAFKVAFTDLTLRNGATPDDGGAIEALKGNLQLKNCVVSDNIAALRGGGINSQDGKVTMTASTVTRNVAQRGGGISAGAEGTLKLTRCTVSGNSAEFDGGGILAGTVTLTQSTVSGNAADKFGGGIFANFSATLLKSTVIA